MELNKGAMCIDTTKISNANQNVPTRLDSNKFQEVLEIENAVMHNMILVL